MKLIKLGVALGVIGIGVAIGLAVIGWLSNIDPEDMEEVPWDLW